MREHWARSPLATRALWMTGFEAGVDSNWGAALAPHETRDLSVVYVVLDEFDEQADPLFVFAPYANDDADRVAFRIKSLL